MTHDSIDAAPANNSKFAPPALPRALNLTILDHPSIHRRQITSRCPLQPAHSRPPNHALLHRDQNPK